MILRDDRELFERPAIEFLPNAVEGATAGGSIGTELSPQLGYGLVNRSLAVKADNRLPYGIVVPAIREPEVSIGVQSGPPIGAQKGPLCGCEDRLTLGAVFALLAA